jgi:response regulator RpfG family c-di-GMP phosphodiesterase
MAEGDPFAVVVSDMRMPGMNGATFLAEARRRWPDTVRMLLTGYSEMDAALAAVNEGGIFRFLTKPCTADTIGAAVADAAEQHRLITAERVLLEQTLAGSIQALVEVLALVNPVAFGRANRLKQFATDLADEIGCADVWAIGVAASVSQLGCATLPPATATAYYEGRGLNRADQEHIDRLPLVAAEFIAAIPRMESVSEILLAQNVPFGAQRDNAPVGAHILKIAHDYDVLRSSGKDAAEAIAVQRSRPGLYDPVLLEVFARQHEAYEDTTIPTAVRLRDLRVGMQFVEDVKTPKGALLIARGHEVTSALLQRLHSVNDNILDTHAVVCTPAPRRRVSGLLRRLEPVQ